MGFHYRFNASGASRWSKCWASKVLSKSAPQRKAGEAALYGTAAHHLGEYCLRNGHSPSDRMEGLVIRINDEGDVVSLCAPPWHKFGFSGIPIGGNDCIKPNKGETIVKVDEKMIEMVGTYTGVIRGIRNKFPNQEWKFRPEFKLELTPDMGGTVDMLMETPGKVFIIDLKTGRNPVLAVNNEQLVLYLLAVVEEYRLDIEKIQFNLVIVQPALGDKLSVWKPTPAELAPFQKRFFEARQAVLSHEANPERFPLAYNPGKHCEWCEAAAICPGMASKTMELVRKELGNLPIGKPLPPPHSLTDDRVLWVAEHAGAIRDWLSAVEEFMTTSAVDGGKVWPGFKLVESQTKRRVVDKERLESFLMKNGFSNCFEPKIVAISKLEKLVPAEVLDAHIEKPVVALVLVPESDIRMSNKNMVALMPPIEKGKSK